MPLRIEVIGEQGALADAPEQALERLADIAVADGADRDEWLNKAVASQGATARSIRVSREPAYQIVDDATTEAVRVYELAMNLCRKAVEARLQRAARDPAIWERYRRLDERNQPRGKTDRR